MTKENKTVQTKETKRCDIKKCFGFVETHLANIYSGDLVVYEDTDGKQFSLY